MTDRLTATLAGDWPDEPEFRRPRVYHLPTEARRNAELAKEARYLVGETGLMLDAWQEAILLDSLLLRPDDTWAALEVGVCCPRQNGKGSILEAREIIALFIDAERWSRVAARLTVHSAQDAKTGHEHYERVLELVEGTPRLRAKLRSRSATRSSEGGEQIILRDRRRIRFRTRTNSGARGLSSDLLVFDEAMILSETIHRAVWPIITARPNPQIWYTGSAVDQTEPMMDEHGVVFSRVRKRGLDADADLLYAEYSVDAQNPEYVTPEQARDPEVWAYANPGLDIRLSRRVIAVEQRSLSPRGFAVERLGAGDWPDPESAGRAIDPERWRACADSPANPAAKMLDPVCLAFDVTPDRSHACIAAAGFRRDRKAQVEIIQHRRGTGWVADALAALIARSRPLAVVLDARASGSLLPALEELRIQTEPVTATEHAHGAGQLFDGVYEDKLKHLDDPKLNLAVASAKKRDLAGAFAWDKKTNVDISPLVAATLALWGLYEHRRAGPQIFSMGGGVEDEVAEPFDEDELLPLGDEDLGG